MSDTDSGTGRRLPNRGVVMKPFRAGEPLGQPLGDRAYLTPRFPSGIKRNQLRWELPEIQRETILFWFLRNYERPHGPYFGFGEATKAPVEDGSDAQVLNGGISSDRGLRGPAPHLVPFLLAAGYEFDGSGRFGGASPELQDLDIGGFDQAPFYNGGPADKFLREELAEWVNQEILSGIAEGLPGQWVPKPDVTMPAAGAGADELRAALSRLLDEFDAGIRELPSREVDRWHNGPPEQLPDELLVLAPEERDVVLRATADMRIAVASNDLSAAGMAWATVSPALAKVGNYMLSLADTYVKELTKKAAGWTIPAVVVAYELAHGVLENGDAIRAILKLLGININ